MIAIKVRVPLLAFRTCSGLNLPIEITKPFKKPTVRVSKLKHRSILRTLLITISHHFQKECFAP